MSGDWPAQERVGSVRSPSLESILGFFVASMSGMESVGVKTHCLVWQPRALEKVMWGTWGHLRMRVTGASMLTGSFLELEGLGV